MALNQWFKMYGGEYLSDPKIASLSAQERSCWITLLSLASISSTPGTIEYLTVEVLLDKSGVPFDPYNPENWNAALGVLTRFEKMKMITKSDEGVIEISNWKKRQETALTNAERQAKYRSNNEKVTKPITKITLDKIREDKNNNTSADEPREVRVASEEIEKPSAKTKYPHSKEVFALWPSAPKNWALNTTQLRAAENLYEEHGIEEITSALLYIKNHNDEEFCPQISTPYDLDSKWLKLEAFYDKQHA